MTSFEQKADEYHAYLQSEHWSKLRKKLFKLRTRCCQACRGAEGFVDAHHLIYRTPLKSGTVQDLMVLCRRCHEHVHRCMQPLPVNMPVAQRFQRTVAFLQGSLGLPKFGPRPKNDPAGPKMQRLLYKIKRQRLRENWSL